MRLPIEDHLPAIREKLRNTPHLILSAAPGAGKTSCVPPELTKLTDKKILLVEPRRIAAKAAASRIAEMNGELPGGRCAGYQVRGERAAAPDTRILAVTPGIMLNLLQDDPLMEEYGAVIFDEFHERKWECDLALAFIDDLERSLDRKLLLVIMSATGDTEKLLKYLPDAGTIDVPGKLHPVEIRWSDDAIEPRFAAEAVARAALRMLNETTGDVLAFLPGAGEIAAAARMLGPSLDPKRCLVLPLHGNLSLQEQSRAIVPDPDGRRKIVLATNVAESSLTIDGITAVVDSGLERRMEYDPGAGMSFLKLAKITRSSAAQRAGRAGRTAPGVALRLWSRFDHASRAEHTIAEILRCELAPLLLETLTWGTAPEELRWLDAPPAAALAEARKLLFRLGAADSGGQLTPLGRRLSALPVHPRLGAMLVNAESSGALDVAIELAALLESNIPVSGRNGADISDLRHTRDTALLRSRLKKCLRPQRAAASDNLSPGLLIAGAFPEWIAQRRGGPGTPYRLAGGGGARLRSGDDLERCEFLAVAGIGGSGSDSGVIRLAAPLDREELEVHFAKKIVSVEKIVFNPDSGRAAVRTERKLGELILSEGSSGHVDPEALARAVVAAAAERGLPIPAVDDAGANRLLARVRFAHRQSPDFYPDWTEDGWRNFWTNAAAEFPIRSFSELEAIPWHDAMRNALGRAALQRLDREFPAVFKPPRGPELKLDYNQDTPTLAVRIQSLYTLDHHPCLGEAKLPLKLELLSPAGRPVQVTSDLPGFWRGSWKIVRKEMKSRYPKHDWPEDPLHPEK